MVLGVLADTGLAIEKFKPINQYILVKPLLENSDDQKTAGGVILPGTSYDALKVYLKGTVVDVSKTLKADIKKGDIVVYKKLFELSVTIDGVKHLVLNTEFGDKCQVLGLERD